MSFWSEKSFLVTGGRGFLGSAVVGQLEALGARDILAPRSRDIDLRKEKGCKEAVEGRDVVIHLAAAVGGIGANNENPGSFFYDNIMMGVQLMEQARLAKVSKFVALGTICAYPKITPVPFKEADLWNGYPEEITAPYGLAKKMLLVQSQGYRAQYGFHSIFLLPTNLYGPRDDFGSAKSHVIPALISKIYKAKEARSPYVEVWGDGTATREFLYVEDAAKGILMATQKYDKPDPVNLGSGVETPIRELVELLCELIGYEGKVRWDRTKPNGQPRRWLDTTRAYEEFGFRARTSLRQGLSKTLEWYEENRDSKA